MDVVPLLLLVGRYVVPLLDLVGESVVNMLGLEEGELVTIGFKDGELLVTTRVGFKEGKLLMTVRVGPVVGDWLGKMSCKHIPDAWPTGS